MSEKYTQLDILCGASYGDGWDRLVDPIVKVCQTLPNVRIDQVKEKFGGLRIYVSGDVPESLHDMIDKAEKESVWVCEECGNPRETVDIKGWLKTLCSFCRI